MLFSTAPLHANNGLSGTSTDIPEKVSLQQNYPNPFNPVTVITYQLPSENEVRLDIYNMLGQRVTTLVDSRVSGGTHEVTFDASGLTSGVYMYRLAVGSETLVRRMTLMK